MKFVEKAPITLLSSYRNVRDVIYLYKGYIWKRATAYSIVSNKIDSDILTTSQINGLWITTDITLGLYICFIFIFPKDLTHNIHKGYKK